MKKIEFTTNENQQKNLFDLCTGIVVFAIVILTFAFNKPIPRQTHNQSLSANTNQTNNLSPQQDVLRIP